MEREAKAKVVASVLGAKFVQFLATLAVLPRSIWKKRMNSTLCLCCSLQPFYYCMLKKSLWAPYEQAKTFVFAKIFYCKVRNSSVRVVHAVMELGNPLFSFFKCEHTQELYVSLKLVRSLQTVASVSAYHGRCCYKKSLTSDSSDSGTARVGLSAKYAGN